MFTALRRSKNQLRQERNVFDEQENIALLTELAS